MPAKKVLVSAATLLASCLAFVATPAAIASATLPKVTVRVEGKTKTLLPSTVVQTNRKAVTRGGHSCSGDTGAGPFNIATKGHWSGKWFSGLGFDPTKILGDSEVYTTKTQAFWELFVNNVASSVGMCSLKLQPGEQILFAAVSGSTSEFPLGAKAPASATIGVPFAVRIVRYDAKGKAKPLAGATVSGGGVKTTTNAAGVATVTAKTAGKLILTATREGFIRSEADVAVKPLAH